MPQQHSFFALKLPHGWWVFGMDLALHEDIDVHQVGKTLMAFGYRKTACIESHLGQRNDSLLPSLSLFMVSDDGWY